MSLKVTFCGFSGYCSYLLNVCADVPLPAMETSSWIVMQHRVFRGGFSLVELVIALAIFAVLIGIGLPSFAAAYHNSRISSQYNTTYAALSLARSAATQSSVYVTACARKTDQSPTCKQGGGDWSDGIVIFTDVPPLTSDGDVVVGAGDEVIHLVPTFDNKNTLTGFGATDNTADTALRRSFITFAPNGGTNWRGTSLTVCDGG